MDAWFDDVWGAGIGSGDDGSEDTITITGGHISSHGCQAPGRGEDGKNGTLQLGDNIWAMSCGEIFPYADRYGYARAYDIELITR